MVIDPTMVGRELEPAPQRPKKRNKGLSPPRRHTWTFDTAQGDEPLGFAVVGPRL